MNNGRCIMHIQYLYVLTYECKISFIGTTSYVIILPLICTGLGVIHKPYAQIFGNFRPPL